MSKANVSKLITLGTVIGIVGLIMLLFNVGFGTSLAESWLMKRGGSDTATYHIVWQGYINTFLVTGAILFSFGLLLVTYAYTKWARHQ